MKPEDYQLIEEYLGGMLSDKEQKAFEARLAKEEELVKALVLRQDMDRHLRKQERRVQLQNTLTQLGEEFFQTEKPKATPVEAQRIPIQRRWYAYAAGLALVITASILLYLNLRPDLYDQYAQHAPLALTVMSAQADALAAQAEQAFNSKNYEGAYQTLKEYVNIHETNNLARFYLGISAMETHRLDEAQTIFDQLKSPPESQWTDYAQWYLALTYLKQDNRSACKSVLEEVRTDSEWYEEARALLRQL